MRTKLIKKTSDLSVKSIDNDQLQDNGILSTLTNKDKDYNAVTLARKKSSLFRSGTKTNSKGILQTSDHLLIQDDEAVINISDILLNKTSITDSENKKNSVKKKKKRFNISNSTNNSSCTNEFSTDNLQNVEKEIILDNEKCDESNLITQQNNSLDPHSSTSDPCSSSDDNSSEGYVSSNQGKKITNTVRLRKPQQMTTPTMTNGGGNVKQQSLLAPFEHTNDEQSMALLDFDNDESINENVINGWSDVNLSTTPPKTTTQDHLNSTNANNKNILLPDVAQLSLATSPNKKKNHNNQSAATLKLNGFTLQNKSRSHSESSSSSSVQEYEGLDTDTYSKKPVCFLLIDEQEVLQVKTAEEFVSKLGCNSTTLVKVVSIFGNTGEGKSHTLNYTFYDRQEVFLTSPTQNSCTIGIWCAYDSERRVITIDTEGLLGLSENVNRRTRLLLKVLAISDIIIYRTRAERLNNDLFIFLGSASQAYIKHFAKELRSASQRCNLQCTLSDLGPVVIIFHETVYTNALNQGKFCCNIFP